MKKCLFRPPNEEQDARESLRLFFRHYQEWDESEEESKYFSNIAKLAKVLKGVKNEK
jgi:hypothetical protein